MTKQLGRYELKDELGHGGMAVVSRAWDPQINRHLAIKVLRPERCTDQDYRARFLRESKAAGALSHPNIVTIYDVGESDNQPYIAMELLDGTPLDQLIRAGHRFEIRDILHIMIQLARALDYAHQNGIVHRDIKPSNIIYYHGNGSEPRIRITDFGIAHVDDASFTQQTQVGDVLGTPQYMSPEQVMGQSVDGRSDLFSAGVILYELLSGRKPFQGETIATLMFRIATEEPGPLDSEHRDIPQALKAIVSRLLQKEADRRFASGMELAVALQQILASTEASRPQTEPQPKRQRLPWPLSLKWPLLTALLLALLYAPGAWWLYQAQSRQLQAELHNNGSNILKLLRRELAMPILSEDWLLVQMITDDLAADPSVKQLLISDHRRQILAGSDALRLNTSLAIPDAILNNSDGELVIDRSRPADRSANNFYTSVRFDNKTVGYIHLSLSTAALQAHQQQLQIWYAGFGLTLLLAMLVLVAVLASRTGSVLVELRKGLQELSRGNVNFRLTRSRGGHGGRVQQEFNRLAARIRDRERNSDSGSPPPRS